MIRRLCGALSLLLGLSVLSLELFLGPILGDIAQVRFQNSTAMLVWMFTRYPLNIGIFISIAMVAVGIVLCLKKEK